LTGIFTSFLKTRFQLKYSTKCLVKRDIVAVCRAAYSSACLLVLPVSFLFLFLIVFIGALISDLHLSSLIDNLFHFPPQPAQSVGANQ